METGMDSFRAPASSFVVDSVIPFVWRLGSVAVGLAAVVGGLLYAKQDSLLYFPEIGGVPRRPADNPRGYRSPAERRVPFEDCRIPCEDGVQIHAWLLLHTTDGVSVPPDTPTVIFFHGNAGNIGLRIPNGLQMVQYLRANVLMVEYRGYGESDSVPPTEAGLKLDAEAALRFALDHPKVVDPTRVFLFGRSLGGAVALHLADYARRRDIPIAGVMVENTFTSISDMVDHLMPVVAPFKALVLRIRWDSTRIVPHLRTPLLFLAGTDDEIVPHGHMQELCRLSKSSAHVAVHIVQGGRHNESWMQGGAAYWDAMSKFMKDAVESNASAGRGGGGGARIGSSVDYSGSMGGTAAAEASSIPTMPSGFLDIAKEAAAGGRNPSGNDKKPKDI